MKNIVKIMTVILAVAMIASVCIFTVTAADETVEAGDVLMAAEPETAEENEKTDDGTSVKAIAAAVIISVVAAVGAVSMALAVMKAVDGSARQPEAAGNIRTSMMMGLVFIETAIIYALIVAILVIFVL